MAKTKKEIEQADDKPNSLCVIPEAIPERLKECPHWVVWKFNRRQDNGGKWKWTKLPINAKTGRMASTTNPDTWSTFPEAYGFYERYRKTIAGIGFVFSPSDPFVGVDLDDCRNYESGTIQKWAAEILAEFASYAEISPTGTGVKIFVQAILPKGRNRRGPVEIYDRGRFFAVTGHSLPETPPSISECQRELEVLQQRLEIGKKEKANEVLDPRPASFSDTKLIERASTAANGEKFSRLWKGDMTGYQSQSEADLALCDLLAFWVGPDVIRMDSLFRQSGLFRLKWDELRGQKTYGTRTIETALAGRKEYYRQNGQVNGTPSKLRVQNDHDEFHGDAWEGEPLAGDLQDSKRPSNQPETFKPLPITICLKDVELRSVEWIWPNWIPRRALTLIDGDPGLGKSTAASDLISRVSRGWAMPPFSGKVADPAGALLLSAEDDLHATIRPRLDAAGADLARVHILTAIRDPDGEERPPVLPWDLALVETMIGAQGIALVVVDPLMAFLDGQIDAHRDADVRRCLHRLKLVAERTGTAILLIRHLNKLIGGPAMYRGGGSIGIIGAVRSALVVGQDPSDSSRRVLAPVKCNLAPMPKALVFTHEPAGEVSRIGWLGETDLLADDILVHRGGSRKKTAGEQCADAIREFLVDGVMESGELDRQCEARGFAANAVRTGRRLAGVKSKRVGFGPEGKYMVMLGDPRGKEGNGIAHA